MITTSTRTISEVDSVGVCAEILAPLAAELFGVTVVQTSGDIEGFVLMILDQAGACLLNDEVSQNPLLAPPDLEISVASSRIMPTLVAGAGQAVVQELGNRYPYINRDERSPGIYPRTAVYAYIKPQGDTLTPKSFEITLRFRAHRVA